MALTAAEKCAGKWFRQEAEQLRRLALNDYDYKACAPCSVYVQFYRHECPEQQGRTRSFPLKDLTYTSPELWVTWADGEMRVISPQEAEDLVAAGEVVEFETVLAGQFSFTWKQGECRFCHLVAVSTDSILKDARPLKAALSGDLASFTQEQSFRVTKGVSREHE